jgi:endonuclease/exonuclease/phosphatase family metal-dependent hydrolase
MEAMSLRVLTWNVWWRFESAEEREEAILSVIEREDPDIVCLQEVWAERRGEDQVERLADALEFHAARTDGPWFDDRSFGNAVLSRWPVVDAEQHVLPREDGSSGHRRALLAVTETPHGSITVISVHFEHRLDGSAVRRRQSATLAQIVANRRGDPDVEFPVIVGGDLNATPDSEEVRVLTGRCPPPVPGLLLMDCWEQAGDGSPGHTWSSANPHVAWSAWPNRRLDYLLVSWPRPRPIGNPVQCWLAGTERVYGVQPSDHYAVVADLETDGVPPGVGSPANG